ncbi:hypothetical protein A1D24_04750 [Testudinibacter aquarius]|nr:hypothetical protein A1D24_04750 [Testudinibacter aquarius]
MIKKEWVLPLSNAWSSLGSIHLNSLPKSGLKKFAAKLPKPLAAVVGKTVLRQKRRLKPQLL